MSKFDGYVSGMATLRQYYCIFFANFYSLLAIIAKMVYYCISKYNEDDMAKRSKKKNPNALTAKQKADVIFNQALDKKKKGLDIRLNITFGIVVGLCIIAFLIMPVVNMNFSSSLSDILGSEIDLGEEDSQIGVTVNMSFLNFLTAPLGGYKSVAEYLSTHTSSSINSSVLLSAFETMMTKEDAKLLNDAYIMILIVAVIWLVSWLMWLIAVCVNRKSNKDNAFLFITSIIFIAVSIAQWAIFIAIAISSAGKAQIQPHIASYLIMAGAVAVAVVYGLYKAKIKKINKQRREVPTNEEQSGDK